jgi:hypothetical protein
MKTVLFRPEPNALTMPPSYSVRHIPRDTIGYDGIADRMARNNPGLTKTQAEANLRAAVRKDVHIERLPMNEKLPQINTAEDTVLK